MKKWTDKEIKKLIKQHSSGYTGAQLAVMHGISRSRIFQLLNTFKRREKAAKRKYDQWQAHRLEQEALDAVLTKIKLKHPYEVIEAYLLDTQEKVRQLRYY